MPTIDLRKIKTIFICPDHNEKYNARRKHIESILKKHGFENVIMYKAGTENYPHCLRYSVYNILQQNLDTPIFVLEDDIVFQKNPSFVFDIPDDNDAVYFGVSGTCMDFEDTGRNRSLDKRDYEIYNDTFIKIKNMLCAHGILYWSKEYKETLSKILLDSTIPCDVDMCKLQPLYNIYGLRHPICWQSTKFNSIDWHEHVTKVRFSETGCWSYQTEEDDS
jgi:hypothetical protein